MNEIDINPANKTLSIPDMLLRCNEIASLQETAEKSWTSKSYYLKTHQKIVVHPNSQEVSNCILIYPSLPEGTCAVVEPLPSFEKQTDLCSTSWLAKLDDARSTPFGLLMVTSAIITVPQNTKAAKFMISTPKHVSCIQPLNPEIFDGTLESFNARFYLSGSHSWHWKAKSRWVLVSNSRNTWKSWRTNKHQ